MNTARQVAEYILTLSNPEIGEIMSNLKLQKLLYFVQCAHLAVFDIPIFEEEIVAWNYGPVVKSVYHDYKIFGSGAIFIPSNANETSIPTEKRAFIENTYAYFGQYSALKLMQMTHEELPWRSTKQFEIISKDKMKSYFKTQTFISEIAQLNQEQRLKNAALLLLADYKNDKELTNLTLLDSEDFYDA